MASSSNLNKILEGIINTYCDPDVAEQYKTLKGVPKQKMLDALKTVIDNVIMNEMQRDIFAALGNEGIQHDNLVDYSSQRQSSDHLLYSVLESLGVCLKVDFNNLKAHLGRWGKKRPRGIQLWEHQQKFEEHLKKQSTPNIGTSQTNSSVIKTEGFCFDFSRLEKTSLRELQLFETAKGKYVEGKIIASPIVNVGITTLFEDANGDQTQLCLYNMIPDCNEKLKLAIMKFPNGAEIKITEPFYKVFVDGNPGIRVDSPEEIIFVTNEENSMSFDKLREKGKIFVKSGDFISALDLYFSHLSKFNDAIVLLNNRAQSHLKLQQFEEALLDAAAVLFMDHGNMKARQRYESAVLSLGFDPHYSNATENASLWRKLLLLESSLFFMNIPTTEVSREMGNRAFKEGNFTAAKEIYSAALSEFDDLAILLNNIAVVCLKTAMFQTAIAAANACLRITRKEEYRTKSLYSMTKAFSLLGEFELANLCAKNNSELAIFLNENNYSFKVVTEALRNVSFNVSFGVTTIEEHLQQFKKEKFSGDYIKANAFEHCYIPGKGRGIKAKENLGKGELLLIDHPVISTEDSNVSMEEKKITFRREIDSNKRKLFQAGSLDLKQKLLAATKYDGLLAKKLLLLQTGNGNASGEPSLPLIRDLKWMAYHNLSSDIPPFLPQTPAEVGVDRSKVTQTFVQNLMSTNVFSWGLDKVFEKCALALRVSFLNHDYNQNCIYLPIGDVLVVVAARDIEKGEELTIRYNEKEHMGKWGL